MLDAICRRDFVRRFAAMAAGASLSGCRSSHLADLAKRVPRSMEDHKVPGVAITLIQDARIAWTRGFGVRDRASAVPVDAATVFEAASMSKPVFAYATLKACENGVMA